MSNSIGYDSSISGSKKTDYIVKKIRQLIFDYSILFVLVIIVIFISFLSRDFLTTTNILNVLRQASINGILACGMTFIMIYGGFDLSVGSTLSLTGVLAIGLQGYIGIIPAVIVALIIGILIGIINGSILSMINGDNSDTFMITLGMMTFVSAIALLYTGGYELRGSKSFVFSQIGKGYLLNIPIPVIIFIVIAVISQFLLSKTGFGRKVYMIGGNIEASRLSGIKVNSYRIIVFSIAGFCAAIGAIILNSRISSASPIAGSGYEFDAIAAVVVGGTSLFGGEGNIYRTVIGVMIISVIANALNLMNVSNHWQMIVRGIIIVGSVWLDIRKK